MNSIVNMLAEQWRYKTYRHRMKNAFRFGTWFSWAESHGYKDPQAYVAEMWQEYLLQQKSQRKSK